MVRRDLPADQRDAAIATGPASSAADDGTQKTSMPVRTDALVWIEQRERREIGGRHLSDERRDLAREALRAFYEAGCARGVEE
jgi:hypothetical protein